jgi:hypothetical protein
MIRNVMSVAIQKVKVPLTLSLRTKPHVDRPIGDTLNVIFLWKSLKNSIEKKKSYSQRRIGFLSLGMDSLKNFGKLITYHH